MTKEKNQKDRNCRGFWLESYNKCRIRVEVPNVHTFNSIQTDINCWISMNGEVEQSELDKTMYLLRKRVKDYLRNNTMNYFKPMNIVAIDTAELSTVRRDYQYFSLEMTSFVLDKIDYDKNTVMQISKILAEEVIDIIEDQQTFRIIRNEKMENRKDKIAKTRNARTESQGF